MIILYTLVLIILSIYSYALIDPNITFFSNNLWVQFRDPMVYFGYYRRDLSWDVYLVVVLILFAFHFLFIKKYKEVNPFKISLIVGAILVFSMPFLSHDFFNYLFDAKILTFYHQNPYLMRALDFPQDEWLRFMQWTHRTYPYGPVFLVITLIPSFLSMGKFVVDFFLFKLLFVTFYILAVFFLNRLNKKWAIIFATHPLILIEGLVSSHNDMIALCLGVIGVYYVMQKNQIMGRLMLLLSGGIKYVSLPIIILMKKRRSIFNLIALVGICVLTGYLSMQEIQPWYFLNFFIFLPYYEKLLNKFNLFFAGLLFSYYPYIFLGGWDKPEKVILKHNIIIIFAVLNGVYLIYCIWKSDRKRNFLVNEVLSSEEHTSAQT